MQYLDEVKTILIDTLALGPSGQQLDEHSALLGSASRRLLLTAVGGPRFDPRPKRKRGRGSKRGDEGFRWSLPCGQHRSGYCGKGSSFRGGLRTEKLSVAFGPVPSILPSI